VFDGQQRQAILSDPTSLSYLCSLQRFMPLPANLQITNGLSFEAKLYDKWGELGSIALSFGYDKKVIELIYVSSTDERNSYLVLDKHLPPKLDEMMTFLLAKENIGKCWTEAGVRSTN
jgi:hypothetical protein